jgi:hypothetical protein
MDAAIFVSTSASQLALVTSVRAELGVLGVASPWLHLGTGPDEQAPDDAELVALDPALVGAEVAPEPKALLRASLELADLIRAVALKVQEQRRRGSSGAHRQRLPLVVVGAMGEHTSNVASLVALQAGREAHRLLGSEPELALDLAASLVEGTRSYAEHDACLGFLTSLLAERPTLPCRSVLALDEGNPEQQVRALVGLVTHETELEQARVAVSGSSQAPCLMVFGEARLAHRPGDLLARWRDEASLDLRRALLLRPFPEAPAEQDALAAVHAPWRQQLEERLDAELRAHLEAGVLVPPRPAPAAGSEPLDALRARLQAQAAAGLGLDDNFQPLEPLRLEQLRAWLRAHFDALLDQQRQPLPVMERFVASICGGRSEPLAQSSLVRERSERAVRRCRGDLVGPLVVSDPSPDGELDLEPHIERALGTDTALKRVVEPLLSSLPADGTDEPRLVAWLEAQLRAQPERILAELERGVEALEPLGGELAAAQEQAGRFFARRQVKEQAAALEGQLRGRRADLVASLEPLVAAWSVQVEQSHGRSRELGGWRSIRQLLEELGEELLEGIGRGRSVVEAAYTERSAASDSEHLVERLASQPGLAPSDAARTVAEAERALREGTLRLISAQQLRAWARGEAPEFLTMLPLELAQRIPLDLEQALLGTPACRHTDVLPAVMRELLGRAVAMAGLDTGPPPAAAAPVALPLLSVPGGEQGELAKAIPRLSSLDSSLPGTMQMSGWTMSSSDPHEAGLDLFCLGLVPAHLARYRAIRSCAAEHRSRQERLGDEVVGYGEIYGGLSAGG